MRLPLDKPNVEHVFLRCVQRDDEGLAIRRRW